MELPEYPNAAFNDEIIVSKSAQDVLAVCELHRAQFNHINAVTALHRIAKVHDGVAVLGEE